MNGTEAPNSICEKVLRYTRALSRWIKSGRPMRTREEIDEIFTSHCRPCESWNPDGSSCRCCGCHVNTSAVAAFNKIAMATENCPMNKW